MERPLRAGIAVYNAGDYHAAHDAWEDVWLDLPTGSDDERFLHGLIQFTAAVYHATERNWSGTIGLCASGKEYLSDLPATYRGVDVGSVRTYLNSLQTDPERIERADPPPLNYKRRRLTAADLDIEAITTAVLVVAEEYADYDRGVVETAADYAREEASGVETRFISLLTTFVDERPHRGIVYDRLARQVERRRERERDVAGLFERREENGS